MSFPDLGVSKWLELETLTMHITRLLALFRRWRWIWERSHFRIILLIFWSRGPNDWSASRCTIKRMPQTVTARAKTTQVVIPLASDCFRWGAAKLAVLRGCYRQEVSQQMGSLFFHFIKFSSISVIRPFKYKSLYMILCFQKEKRMGNDLLADLECMYPRTWRMPTSDDKGRVNCWRFAKMPFTKQKKRKTKISHIFLGRLAFVHTSGRCSSSGV